MITLIHESNGTMVIGYNVYEDETTIKLLYPIGLYLSNPASLNTSVIGYKYSPFAKDDEVLFFKASLTGKSTPIKKISDYYEGLVKSFQEYYVGYKEVDKSENKIPEGMTEEEYYEQLGEEFLKELEKQEASSETNNEEDTNIEELLNKLLNKSNKTLH